MSDLGDRLRSIDACEEACEWADGYDNPGDAWAACERGDWMLWVLGLLSGPPESESRRKLVLALCACVRLALEYVPDGRDHPRIAMDTAERWARRVDGVTLRDVKAAADAYAVLAPYADAYAVLAPYAAAVAYYAPLRQCADIVRSHYPNPPELPALKVTEMK